MTIVMNKRIRGEYIDLAYVLVRDPKHAKANFVDARFSKSNCITIMFSSRNSL